MEDNNIDSSDIVHLARLALAGKPKDVHLYVRRLINRYRRDIPELAEQLGALLRDGAKSSSSPLRGSVVDAIPVDLDSRLQLARSEYPVLPETEPVWSPEIREHLEQIVLERERESELLEAALHPTKSALFIGAPGVGKTLAAKWVAGRLDRPLITLDSRRCDEQLPWSNREQCEECAGLRKGRRMRISAGRIRRSRQTQGRCRRGRGTEAAGDGTVAGDR